VNGIDFVVVTALVLLVALAVAAGLLFAQDRAEAHIAAVGKQVQELRVAAPDRFCGHCGRELPPM
jgi:hypothetical protein